eukprot:15478484-Alexandrium_andersonii.AAC.1
MFAKALRSYPSKATPVKRAAANRETGDSVTGTARETNSAANHDSESLLLSRQASGGRSPSLLPGYSL